MPIVLRSPRGSFRYTIIRSEKRRWSPKFFFFFLTGDEGGERVLDKTGESEFRLGAPHLSLAACLMGSGDSRGPESRTGEIKRERERERAKKEQRAGEIPERRTLAERMITDERSSF